VTRILLLYGLSGFVSLGYQVAWFRIVTDWFGSTNITFALVIVNFIGGLAVGSLTSRRTSDFLSRRLGLAGGLRIYGVFELLVAASIALSFVAGALPADLWGSFPYRASDGIWTLTLGYRLFQAAIASAAVFLPCMFMGATFPLLCERLAEHPRAARLPAALYAWNTLGACSGVLACQFLLLPRLGHDVTLALMAGINTLLGLTFLVWRPDTGRRDAQLQLHGEPDHATPAATPAALLALVTLGGFLAGALEGDLFKRVTFVIALNPGATMSFISFWAILGIFLASAAVHRARGLRLSHIRVAFVLAALYCALVWPQIDTIRDFVEASVTPADVEIATTLEGFRNLQFPGTLVQLLVFVGILVFPPYFLVSLLLPYVCTQLQGERTHLGLAYGLNTGAFCLGLLGFVLIAPMVNIFYSLKLFPVVFAGGAIWLFLVHPGRPLARWKPAALLAGLGAALLLVSSDFDRSFFRPGSPPAIYPVRAVKSDGAHTTFVVEMAGSPRLFFGRLQMSATNLRAQSYMRLMAHFPLLLHENPEKALLICLGAGNTGSAIARHPSIRQIDVVDLNPKVFETVPEFAETHHDLHLDPRVRFIADDGRSTSWI
jgi:spermidine synthase